MIVQLWDMLRQNVPTAALLLLLLSFVVQITPIKINPWSAALDAMSKKLTEKPCMKIDSIREKLDEVDSRITENEKDRIRWEILDFANSCRNGRTHTRDEFQHIVSLNEKYKQLLSQTNDSNGVFEIEFEYIKNIYAEHLEKNDFLR